MCRLLLWLRAYSPQLQCVHVTVTDLVSISPHVTQTQCSPVIIDAAHGVGAAYGVLPTTIHENIRPRLD